MKKIVINRCFGSFGLSEKVMDRLVEMLGYDEDGYIRDFDGERDNPNLVAVVEELGDEANAMCAKLEIVEIPDEATDYYIDEYDGLESVIYVVDGKIHFA